MPALRDEPDDPTDSGDTAWVLTSAALVMLMTPALAMFYGGFVSDKAVVNTMMMSFASLAVISVMWSLFTYSLAFGPGDGDISPWIGSNHFGLFDSADRVRPGTDIPEHAFMMFQLMFAVITAAVVSGSVVQRISLWAWTTFALFWHIIVYVPLARWIFYPGGWLAKWGVLDFAGGFVVETASGVSGFVLAFWIGPSPHKAAGGHGPAPHNVPFILLGAGLLFFGWFGFNAGSALASGYLSSRAFANTHLCAAAACCGWAICEWIWSGWRAGGRLFTGRTSAVGAATGVIVGLVAITPACGYVSQMDSVFIGVVTAFFVYHLSHFIHSNSGVDDTLDCFGGHGVSGMLGTIWTGLWAQAAEGSPVDGAFYGNPDLLGKQLAALCVTIAMCVVGTTLAFALTAALSKITGIPLRIPMDAGPDAAVDDLLHGEKAYSTLAARSRSRGWSLGLPFMGSHGNQHQQQHGGHTILIES